MIFDKDSQFSEFVEAVNTHLAESAGKHITESGSNADGYFIKYDDGTMKCWATQLPIATNRAFGSIRRSGGLAKTTPASFIDTNVVVHASLDDELVIGFANGRIVDVNTVAIVVYAETDVSTTCAYSATGRWK